MRRREISALLAWSCEHDEQAEDNVTYRPDHHNHKRPDACSNSCSSLFFVLELNIDVANHMISDVVSYNYFIDFTKFTELHKNLFIEVLEVVDSFD